MNFGAGGRLGMGVRIGMRLWWWGRASLVISGLHIEQEDNGVERFKPG